jgi:hypothetical protein
MIEFQKWTFEEKKNLKQNKRCKMVDSSSSSAADAAALEPSTAINVVADPLSDSNDREPTETSPLLGTSSSNNNNNNPEDDIEQQPHGIPESSLLSRWNRSMSRMYETKLGKMDMQKLLKRTVIAVLAVFGLALVTVYPFMYYVYIPLRLQG